MKRLLLTAFLGVCLLSTTAFSQLLFSEDFTGLTAGTIIGQSGWTQGGGTLFLSIANTTPLTYTGYNGGGGAYAVMPVGTSSSARVFKTFTPTGVVASGNVYYISFLLNLTQVFAMGATTSNYSLALGDAAGSSSNLCPKLYARTDVSGTGFNLGVSKQTTTNTAITWGASVLNLNTTYLIIEKYVFNTLGAGYDDGVYLWVNPNFSSEPLTTAAECQNNGTTNTVDLDFDNYQTPAGGIGSFVWNNRGAGNPVGAFDGVRVAYGTSSALAWGFLNPTTPVELTSFTASVSKTTVNLKWSTATEINNKGFEVQRRLAASKDNFAAIAFINGQGSTTEKNNYAYNDKLTVTGKYEYRLKQIDYSGTYAYSSITEADVKAPVEFGLSQNYPNPFNPSTMINFTLAKSGNVSLKVYNLLGQEVRSLMSGFKEAGSYNVNFNAAGLNSGLYFYKLETESFSQVRKMTLLK
jgi:hypothetical protein